MGLLVFASPANAATPDCKTVTSNLVNRPDNGNHGIWSNDTFTRTVEVCVVPPPSTPALQADSVEVQTWKYHAKVTDSGTFVTLAGAHLSPEHGNALLGGVNGKIVGGFTADFTAPHDWGFWNGAAFDGKTLTGAAGGSNPTTSDWVKALWSDGFKGSSINDDWTWTHTTCNEQWKETAKGNTGEITGSFRVGCVVPTFVDTCSGTTVTVKTTNAAAQGQTWYRVNNGEIVKLAGNTEKTYNVPSSTVTFKVQQWLGKWNDVATHTWKLPSSCVSASVSTAPAVGNTTPSLPVTGAKIPVFAGVGVGLVGVGGLLFFLARRHRKTEFVSE
jgi:LPXTG-motif cell wall-anchored protein